MKKNKSTLSFENKESKNDIKIENKVIKIKKKKAKDTEDKDEKTEEKKKEEQ